MFASKLLNHSLQVVCFGSERVKSAAKITLDSPRKCSLYRKKENHKNLGRTINSLTCSQAFQNTGKGCCLTYWSFSTHSHTELATSQWSIPKHGEQVQPTGSAAVPTANCSFLSSLNLLCFGWWFSKCHPWVSSTRVTWEVVRNASSLPHPTPTDQKVWLESQKSEFQEFLPGMLICAELWGLLAYSLLSSLIPTFSATYTNPKYHHKLEKIPSQPSLIMGSYASEKEKKTKPENKTVWQLYQE